MAGSLTSPVFNPKLAGFSPLIRPQSKRYTRREVTGAAIFWARDNWTAAAKAMSETSAAQSRRWLIMPFILFFCWFSSVCQEYTRGGSPEFCPRLSNEGHGLSRWVRSSKLMGKVQPSGFKARGLRENWADETESRRKG